MPVRIQFIPWFCGLPCAGMTVGLRKARLVAIDGGCLACRDEVALFRTEARPPLAFGKKTTTAGAIEAAAGILREARLPFVYGLSRSATATARRAAGLARALGGAIDVEGSESIHADLVALSTFGLPSATFGEIRNRADLLLLWRCDPRLARPGLFGGPPEAREPGARPVILVPPHGAAAEAADLVLTVDDGADLDAALSLRALVNGAAPDGERPGGVPVQSLRGAADRLLRARYSAIVWDGATGASVNGVAIVATLTLLARDLNRTTRSVARPLGAGGNVAGAVAALAAATGYPRAIGFGGEAPRFAPGEFDAARMIGERRADVLLLVGARSAGAAGDGPGGPETDKRIKDDAEGPAGRIIPARRREGPRIIVIGPLLPEGVVDADVWIPTATPGLSAAGTAARADGVTVVLKALLPTRRPTEDEILDALLQRLAKGNRPRGR